MEAHFTGNIKNGLFRGAQKMLCHGQPHMNNILLGPHSHVVIKSFAKIADAHVAAAGQLLHAQVACILHGDDVQDKRNLVSHGIVTHRPSVRLFPLGCA